MVNLIPLTQDLDKSQSILLTNIPWSPLDFIRDISTYGDKYVYVEHLTRKIEKNNDFRYICHFSDGLELAIFAERLPWDSNFFGYDIGKINGIFPLTFPYYRPHADYLDALQKFVGTAKKRGIKYLFAFVSPEDLATMRALGKLGFSLIETRLYYHIGVKDYNYKERYPVRIANASDIDNLGNAAQSMINLYDRFHADPFIEKEDADRLMYKWVEASILDGFADVTIVPDVLNPTAFCTVKYHKDKWEKWGLKLAQIVFTVVSTEFKGWFRKILSEVNHHLRDIGAEYSYYTTQITNIKVTWVLESLGYRFGKGEHVMRIVL